MELRSSSSQVRSNSASDHHISLQFLVWEVGDSAQVCGFASADVLTELLTVSCAYRLPKRSTKFALFKEAILRR